MKRLLLALAGAAFVFTVTMFAVWPKLRVPSTSLPTSTTLEVRPTAPLWRVFYAEPSGMYRTLPKYRDYGHLLLSPEVLHEYRTKDADGDGTISWVELMAFLNKWWYIFDYRDNAYAMHPNEFFFSATGDCEDFAIFVADFLRYWGFPAYVGVVESDAGRHAVALVQVPSTPEPYDVIYLDVAEPVHGEVVPEGHYLIIDYTKVGGFSPGTVEGAWWLAEVWPPSVLYGARM